MISSKDIEDYSYIVSARFEAINSHYLKLIAKQINDIGRLGPANLHRLQQMARYNQNITEINNLLAQETNRTIQELYQVYDMSGFSLYGDYAKMYKTNGKTQVPFKDNTVLQGYLNSVKNLTQGTFLNMSNTTVASHSNYKNLIDTAIDAVATGQADYNSIIRQQMIAIADEGLTVTYDSGYKRRLDSAVRMNILEGVRQVNDGVRQVAGEEFGADGVEISVHALCAEDHIDIQGKQFAIGNSPQKVAGKVYPAFDVVNGNLKRHIGTCNCKHIRFPIILGISEPAYSDEELAQYKANSEKPVNLTMGYDKDGNPITKTVTKYQATQVQRNIETEIRRAKDRHIIAENAGDSVAQKQAKDRILALRKNYKRISDEAGLTPKWDRTFVAGYTGRQTTPKPITLSSMQKFEKYNAMQEQIRLLEKYNNVQNIMLLGTSEDMELWYKSHNLTKMSEKDIINELYKDPDNWEIALKLQKEEMLEPFFNQLLDTATDSELSALNMWTGETYRLINRYARYGLEVDSISKDASIKIESILNKLKTPRELIVHRGTGIKHILSGVKGDWKKDIDLLVGHKFKDDGFTATSPLSSGAFGGAGVNNAELFIKVPKGTHGAYIALESHLKLEKEFLLQKGYTYKIVKAEYRPNPLFPEEKDLKIWCEIVNK